MRSDRVFDALHTLRNRYMLCQLASKATRKFHRPNTRIQETMNQVFDKIADAERHDILRNLRILPKHNGELLKQPRRVPTRRQRICPARDNKTLPKKSNRR